MTVKLLNAFIVPDDKEDEFLMNWRVTADYFSRTPGFVETHLHRNTGVGNPTFKFINIATWTSAQAWKDTHDVYQPKENLIPGVKGHPAIFEPIVDLFHKD